MVKLDEVLQKLFGKLDIANMAEINDELRKILEEAHRINAENERISARYDGNYAFAKTYTDIGEAEFLKRMNAYRSALDEKFSESHRLESEIMNQIGGLKL